MSKITFDSFRQFTEHDLSRFKTEPDCFNGKVNIQKYRYTIEPIDEPIEVIRARLLKLWRESDNSHHYRPLQDKAAEYGIELPSGEFRRDRRK